MIQARTHQASCSSWHPYAHMHVVGTKKSQFTRQISTCCLTKIRYSSYKRESERSLLTINKYLNQQVSESWSVQRLVKYHRFCPPTECPEQPTCVIFALCCSDPVLRLFQVALLSSFSGIMVLCVAVHIYIKFYPLTESEVRLEVRASFALERMQQLEL